MLEWTCSRRLVAADDNCGLAARQAAFGGLFVKEYGNDSMGFGLCGIFQAPRTALACLPIRHRNHANFAASLRIEERGCAVGRKTKHQRRGSRSRGLHDIKEAMHFEADGP